jgi:hypothetical protein
LREDTILKYAKESNDLLVRVPKNLGEEIYIEIK